MIELIRDDLVFSFPDIHPAAKLTITFQRTLRIPDDGRTYPLPPGLGSFPLRHVDDFRRSVPDKWRQHGGVMLPMYQSEALWLNFDSAHVANRGRYPFAVKIATGKINAVSGEAWQNGLSRSPQDYVVSPRQPWLDGYCVEKGSIRQFVAMPLGEGFSAEEQMTGEAEHGGIQIIAYPMQRSSFEKYFPAQTARFTRDSLDDISACMPCVAHSDVDMALAPGGKMRQEIYDDPYRPSDWCHDVSSRCFVHLCNSQSWQIVTGSPPPTRPITARDYTQAGMPWFEYYGDPAATVTGSKKLNSLTSVAEMKQNQHKPMGDNESVKPQKIIVCESPNSQVREGDF